MEILFSNIESLLIQLKAAKHIYIQELDRIDPVGIAVLKQYKVSNPEISVRTSGESHRYVEKLLHDIRDTEQNHLPLEHFDHRTNNIDEIIDFINTKGDENRESVEFNFKLWIEKQ